MRKGMGITLIIVLILVIGGYFFFSGDGTNNSDVVNTGQSLVCNVGNNIVMPTPFGMAMGTITEIMAYSFANGETIDVCCKEVETDTGRKVKVCESFANGEEYRVAWEFKSGSYVKFEEYAPQFGTKCTNYFDEDGEWSSRSCGESTPVVQNTEAPQESISNGDGCSNIENQEQRDECYYDLAKENLDEFYCEKIQGSSKGNCYYLVALGNGDSSICSNIENKDLCYYDIGRKYEDTSSCEQVQDSDMKIRCLAEATNDESLCASLPEGWVGRDSCYLTIAKKQNDLAICDLIEDESSKDLCISAI